MDISVLILFFNRADSLQKVFDEVRRAQPARLFLYQDGPRGERDMAGIMACRKVVEQVDWPCEVHRNYSEVNHGCDPSEYLSQKWAFSIVDRCIVLEDDDVPTQSFFRFCQEMLDRYADDPRIGMIAGFNPEEETHLAPQTLQTHPQPLPEREGRGHQANREHADNRVSTPLSHREGAGVGLEGSEGPASYFFTRNFSIWGWASWRRVVDQWDGQYSWLDDPAKVEKLEEHIRRYKLRDDFIPMCRAHRAQGKEFYETIFCAHMWMNDLLAVVPTKNQINNLGVSDDSTHFAGSIQQLPRGYRRIFTMGRHELDFPLVHPDGSEPGEPHEEYVPYRESVYRIMAWGHPWIKVCRSVEELLINIRHGQWSYITRAVKNRWRKMTKGQDYR